MSGHPCSGLGGGFGGHGVGSLTWCLEVPGGPMCRLEMLWGCPGHAGGAVFLLTDAEELGVHAVEVGDEDKGQGPCGVEEEQEASREVEHQPPSMYHQAAGQLLRQHQPGQGAFLSTSLTPCPLLSPIPSSPPPSSSCLSHSSSSSQTQPLYPSSSHPHFNPSPSSPSLPHHPPSPSNLLNLICQPHYLPHPITIPSLHSSSSHHNPIPFPHSSSSPPLSIPPCCAPFLSHHPHHPLLILTSDPSVPLHPHQPPSPLLIFTPSHPSPPSSHPHHPTVPLLSLTHPLTPSLPLANLKGAKSQWRARVPMEKPPTQSASSFFSPAMKYTMNTWGGRGQRAQGVLGGPGAGTPTWARSRV